VDYRQDRWYDKQMTWEYLLSKMWEMVLYTLPYMITLFLMLMTFLIGIATANYIEEKLRK
jgi:hypothetical protein